jgi:hypothetical protein
VKKAAAIFFITLFLFNLFGYRLVVEYLQQRVSEQLDAKLDSNQYKESQLVELKVPMNLPYQNDVPEYQRCVGEIDIQGISYKYVKRKMVNDTLYLMCIPNTKKMHLETAKNNFFGLSNDLMQSSNSKKSDNAKISFKNLQGDYDEYCFTLSALDKIFYNGNFYTGVASGKLLASPHVSPEQPPDIIA